MIHQTSVPVEGWGALALVDNRLVDTVVRSLSGYLIHRKKAGIFDDRLENLLNRVEIKMSDAYSQEMLERFRDRPDGDLETDTLRGHLVRAMDDDPEFGRQLALTFQEGHTMTQPVRRGRGRLIVGGVVAVVVLGGGFTLGRTTAPDSEPRTAPTVTSTVRQTVTRTESPTSTPAESASAAPSSSPSEPGIPGDGSTYPEGRPVPLVELPRPNDQWLFSYGDHDVQFKQFTNSLWQTLDTCNDRAYSREQQFRLKNFSRLEVKAVGTDSKADPSLVVQFDVYANNDNVHPIKSVVVNPGETQQLAVDLPKDVFTVTLRMSLTSTGRPCRSGDAVWGEPYVIATGS